VVPERRGAQAPGREQELLQLHRLPPLEWVETAGAEALAELVAQALAEELEQAQAKQTDA